MADWKKMKAEYIRSKVSYRKLAEKYGVSPSTLYRRMKSEKWADLRKQTDIKANAKIVESISNQEASRSDNIQTAADLLLDKIVEGLKNDMLIATGAKLRDISGALKDIRDIKGMKSELDMQEQIARIEKLKREATIEESVDKTIVVEIKGELDEWSN